ncbi:chemotaxis protein CheC [Aureibacillus halotolerans]|uniref:Chemotaxis protein CheC n=1 Tax=Aureibacillus halotolerans TaxID=1508390 RepID=A0A4R6U092_9BACI|nr:chemotaxis protein CheC [Aureibacillus halotolerans]TDQ39670.1 chemotaxis protein CheC [Aureibacillus halotolerans]
MTHSQLLNDAELDVLKEIGSIGAGHAAGALSELIGRPVMLQVPSVHLLGFDDALERLGGADSPTIASVFRVSGEAEGWMFVLFSPETAHALLTLLLGERSKESFKSLEFSAVGEVGNIVLGAYLTAIYNLTKLTLSPSVPNVVFDMVGAVLSAGLAEASAYGDEVLFIDSAFKDIGPGAVQFLFMPHLTTYQTFLDALGAAAK